MLTQSTAYRIQAINILGNKCTKCGIDDIRVLQIDHVKPHSKNKHLARGFKLYRQIVTNSISLTKVQLLCANCHVIKTRENGEYQTNKIRLINNGYDNRCISKKSEIKILRQAKKVDRYEIYLKLRDQGLTEQIVKIMLAEI